MPPHVPRKRVRTPSPVERDTGKKSSGKAKAKASATDVPPPRKSTVFDDLDAGAKNRSAEKTKSALQQMHDDDSSSLSSLSDSDIEFEDIPVAKRQKFGKGSRDEDADEDDDDDEDIEFEDVPHQEPRPDPVPSGDLELTLYQDNRVPLLTNLAKKGASKREKHIRNVTHCIHVQFLLWHNAVRNSWLCDEEVQAIMISHLPPRLWEEVDRWRQSSGLEVIDEPAPKIKKGAKDKTIIKSKGKGKQAAARPPRDWSDAADRLEKGVPDLSHGDPLFRLMKVLCGWWKQRFQITGPGLRKLGYMDVRRLGKWRESFQTDEHDPEKYGEKILNLDHFRQQAQKCEGSRDVGAQLFTALLRGIGLEARMVANIQSLGFGWSKMEEADDEKPAKGSQPNGTNTTKISNGNKDPTPKKKTPARPASRRVRKTDKDALKMDLDDSDQYGEPVSDENDDDSADEAADETPRPKRATKTYDKDLDFAHYWSEILSPVTQKYLPVDAIVKSVVGTNRELIESLEPRGGKADKAKQIMAYVVGFSQDGTAKDVTVRYLRKQLYPGKTKGVRMPVERIPVYDKHGKIRRYEQFDWWKSVMRGYTRGGRRHPITEVDEVEDSIDLKPAVPEKKEVKEGAETLQYYKTSKEFVLERHLKREEALLPSAIPAKTFQNKGKGGKVEEDNVYLRKDVVSVKSAETWHKQGRAPILGEVPLKHAPYRAATTNRRRELAEAEARTGEKVLQPLYSFDQTEWIIPDPIQDGIIPKNEYGNIDMFAEHMCPEGAVHLPYRGAVRVCKRLGVDYAEAVVGFEFGHRMAVPVIQGVVIAEEHQGRVIEEIEKDEVERARKEDEKRRKTALGMWRKFIMGLRIADRIRQDYGHLEDAEIFRREKNQDKDFQAMRQKDEEMAGGFLPEGYEEEEVENEPRQTSSYFPVADEDDDDGNEPFEMDGGIQDEAKATSAVDPDSEPEEEVEESKPAPKGRKKIAKAKAKPKPKPKPSTRRRTRKNKVESSDEDDDDEDGDFAMSDSF